MSKLILIGCSWGCGEWINNHDQTLSISHPGMTDYLSQDHSVTNLSRAASSNWQSVFALRNYLQYCANPEYSADSTEPIEIFVLQTDAARTNVSEKYDVDYESILLKSHGLKNYYQILIEIFYIKLHNLAQQYNIKINMIGGLTDLELEIMSLYINLQPCCASWIKLLDPRHEPSVVPLILDPRLLKLAKSHNKMDLFEDIINHSDEKFLQAQQLMETEFFGPAHGDFHPSRKGHKVMADYIDQYLKDQA